MNTPVLPDNLPEPLDDGACAHLEGMAFPAVALASTDGPVTLAAQPGTVVVYLYPRSSPDHDDPDGWDAIPGARGCSPQGCAFRDHQAELAAHDARVFGLSTQAVDYLSGEVARLHLPFPLISDSALVLREALQLPLLDVPAGVPECYRRITLILRAGRIVKVFYPVFPPDKNAEQVLAWLQAHPGQPG